MYGHGLIGEEKQGGDFRTYHFDSRGSTVAITDIWGNITDTLAYDTYGKCISHIGNSFVIFGYNGRDGVITDKNGLLYMRARYYSPDMRRFVNADIVSGDISNAVTLNRYAYANGNPVSFVDPFGLWSFKSAWNNFTSWVSDTANDVKDWVNDNIIEPASQFWCDNIVKPIKENVIESIAYNNKLLAEEQLKANQATADLISGVFNSSMRKKADESFLNAIEAKIEYGYGIGASSVNTGAYINKSIILGLDNGETYTAHEFSGGIGVGIVGYSFSYIHLCEVGHDRINCKPYHPYEDTTIPTIASCPNTVFSESFGIGPFYFADNGDVSIVFEVSAYTGIGGALSFGFNISDFLRGIFE